MENITKDKIKDMYLDIENKCVNIVTKDKRKGFIKLKGDTDKELLDSYCVLRDKVFSEKIIKAKDEDLKERALDEDDNWKLGSLSLDDLPTTYYKEVETGKRYTMAGLERKLGILKRRITSIINGNILDYHGNIFIKYELIRNDIMVLDIDTCEKMTIKEWAKKLNILPVTVYTFLKKRKKVAGCRLIVTKIFHD